MSAVRPSCTLVELAELRAADVMSRDALTVAEHESLAVAWELLARGGCRFLPVLRSGRVVGVIDDHAMVTSRSTRFLDGRPRLVGDASHPTNAVHESTPLPAIVERMASGSTGLVVIDDSGFVVGVITAATLVGLLGQALPDAACRSGANRANGRRAQGDDADRGASEGGDAPVQAGTPAGGNPNVQIAP